MSIRELDQWTRLGQFFDKEPKTDILLPGWCSSDRKGSCGTVWTRSGEDSLLWDGMHEIRIGPVPTEGYGRDQDRTGFYSAVLTRPGEDRLLWDGMDEIRIGQDPVGQFPLGWRSRCGLSLLLVCSRTK